MDSPPTFGDRVCQLEDIDAIAQTPRSDDSSPTLCDKVCQIEDITAIEQTPRSDVPTTPRIANAPDETLRKREFGVTVTRGPDWKWGDQDGGIGSKGETLDRKANDGCIWVRWPHGATNLYRVGAEGSFDLKKEAPSSNGEIQEDAPSAKIPSGGQESIQQSPDNHLGTPPLPAALPGTHQAAKGLKMFYIALCSLLVLAILVIVVTFSIMLAVLQNESRECRDDIDTLRGTISELSSRLESVESKLLNIQPNRTAQALSNLTSRMEVVEKEASALQNVSWKVTSNKVLIESNKALMNTMIQDDIPGMRHSIRMNAETLADHGNLLASGPSPSVGYFASAYRQIKNDDDALAAFHSIYSSLLRGIHDALELYLQGAAGTTTLFTGAHPDGELWKGEVNVYSDFFSAAAQPILVQQITPQLLGESVLAVAWILYAHQSYTVFEATPYDFPTGPLFEDRAKFHNFIVGTSLDMLQILKDVAALQGHSLMMNYSLEIARQWFVLTKIRFEDHLQNPAILNYEMYYGPPLGSTQFTLWRYRSRLYLPINGLGYRFHPVQTMRACVAHYQWYIRVFEEEKFVFHSYANNVPSSSLGYDFANVRTFAYDNPFTGITEQKNMYWNLNQPTLATDFYLYRFDLANQDPFTSMFDLPAKFADSNTFRNMYDYLATSSSADVLAEVEFLYSTQLIPAADRLQQLYEESKQELLVDDDFPGLFRQLLPKAISHLDFSNKEVVNQDGTRVSFADDRIIKMVKHHSANVGALLQTVPGDDFSYLERLDDNKIYTSIDDVLDNYGIKSVPTYEVDGDVLLSDTKKTLTAAMFHGGLELVKFFDDLREYVTEDATNKGTYPPSFSSGSKSDWDVLGFYYGLHTSDPKFNAYNPNVQVSQAEKDDRVNHFFMRFLTDGSTIFVPKFDPTLGIDYLFLEHYQVDPTTHYPQIGPDNYPVRISESEWKGWDLTSWCDAAEEDRYLQRTFFMKMYEHQGAAWFKSLFRDHTVNGVSKPPQAPILEVWDAEISEIMATKIFLLTREKQFGSAASNSYILEEYDVLNCLPKWYHKYIVPSVSVPLVAGTGMMMQWVITGDPAKTESPKYYGSTFLHENFGHGMDHLIPPLLGYTAKSESWLAKGATVGSYYAFFYGSFTEGFATWFELFGHLSGLYGTYLVDQGVYDFSSPDPYSAISGIQDMSRLAARWICVAALHDVTVGRSFAWLVETWSQVQGYRWPNGWERTIYSPAQQASYASGLVSNLVAVNSVKQILRANNLIFDARKFNRWRITDGKPYLGAALVAAATREAMNFTM